MTRMMLSLKDFFEKKCRKLWKNNLKKELQNNKAPNKAKFVPKSDKNPGKGPSKPIQCYECQGYGHTAAKCAN